MRTVTHVRRRSPGNFRGSVRTECGRIAAAGEWVSYRALKAWKRNLCLQCLQCLRASEARARDLAQGETK